MKRNAKQILLSFALLTLAGCEGTKEQLGLSRTVPDEFAIIKRAPLEMPPDYSLRPPRPGATRPQEAAPELEAQRAMFGEQATTSAPAKADGGEAAILQRAGTSINQPNIRQQVDEETSKLSPREKPVAEKLLGWTTGGSDEPEASVVDPKAETERLKKNIEEGKPITDGETPVIED